MADTDSRRPRSLYGEGEEPDPRFSMANERTALAWIRSSLALLAAGAGLTSLVRLADLPRTLDAVAVVMCFAGALLGVASVQGWRDREVAMRLGEPLPMPVALWAFAAFITVLGLVMAGIIVVSALG